MNRKTIIPILVLAASLAGGCSALSDSSSSSSAASSSVGRLSVQDVLSQFSSENGTLRVTYSFLAQDGTTVSPISQFRYLPRGYEVHFLFGWDVGKTTYGFLNLPHGFAISSVSSGSDVYDYTLDADGGLLLGDPVSGGTDTNVYDLYASPKYLSDNAAKLAADFVQDATKSDTVNITDAAEVLKIAKAVESYGPLSYVSGVSFSRIALTYTTSGTSFTYDTYISYEGVEYLGARSVLSAIGTTKVAAISAYLGA